MAQTTLRNMLPTLVGVASALVIGGYAFEGCSGGSGGGGGGAVPSRFASESGTIQISNDDSIVYSINREIDGPGSMTAVRVRVGASDVEQKLGEVRVGNDPWSLSVNGAGTRAYVSNAADGTVSVVDLLNMRELTTIDVGSEPRGTALTPSGNTLYVANFSDGNLSVIDVAPGSLTENTVVRTLDLGIANPLAVTVSNDNDGLDADESIYVSDFFGRTISSLSVDAREGFDDAREGLIVALSVDEVDDDTVTPTIDTIPLAPRASGFSADRTTFDPVVNVAAVNSTYAGTATEPQDTFFNQLYNISVDNGTNKLYVNAIGASPEPPVRFNVNVQALVGVIEANAEVTAESTNLNQLIAPETQPGNPAGSLVRAFAADTVDASIRGDVVVFVSRAGSYLLRASFDTSGALELDNSASTPAVRIATGNTPNGVILNSSGTRAYVNNEVDQTVTAIDLDNDTVIDTLICSDLPPVGSTAHNSLIGKLAFFTGMGVDPVGPLVGANVRDLDTIQFRDLASDNNWSSCASCHPDGLADGVTWIFATGPRQTVPLDGSYSPVSPDVQRVFNWNAVRSSVTDFNNNARNVQGGTGFTPQGDTDAGLVFNHGPDSGISDALDLMTLWVQRNVRTWDAPSNLNASMVAAGRSLFQTQGCADCHGSELWTTSRVRFTSPLFDANPLAGGNILDARILNAGGAGPVLLAFDADGNGTFDDAGNSGNDAIFDAPIVTQFDDGMGAGVSPTLDLTDPNEIRGAGGAIATAPPGAAASFNPPSLLGARNSAPYGHSGRARTLEEVFGTRASGGLGHPPSGLSAADIANLAEFLRSIDGSTPPF